MSEPIETIELSEQDQEDLAKLYQLPDGVEPGDPPTFHTILEVWREVLRPAHDEAKQKVTPQWAARITATYREVDFADMNEFRYRYFTKIFQLEEILKYEIESDPDCLTYTTPEEDAEHNSVHYKNVLMLWQQQVLQWELDWDCEDHFAGVELAAISEIHKMFFGQTGLTQFLDSIRFEFTEEDQATLTEILEEQKSGKQKSSKQKTSKAVTGE